VTIPVLSLLAVVAFAAVHLVAGKLRFLEVTPRSVLLSMAGGASERIGGSPDRRSGRALRRRAGRRYRLSG